VDSLGSEWGLVAGSCEHDSELPASNAAALVNQFSFCFTFLLLLLLLCSVIDYLKSDYNSYVPSALMSIKSVFLAHVFLAIISLNNAYFLNRH
jgi:hypothetical protein